MLVCLDVHGYVRMYIYVYDYKNQILLKHTLAEEYSYLQLG